MTQHVSEDTLLELALGLLDTLAESRVRHHLQGCPLCLGLSEDVEKTLHHIKDVAPKVNADIPPLPLFRLNRYKWLRVAAMLAIGFGMGVLASESFRSPSIQIVQQQIISKPPELPAAEFVACEGVDLPANLRNRGR